MLHVPVSQWARTVFLSLSDGALLTFETTSIEKRLRLAILWAAGTNAATTEKWLWWKNTKKNTKQNQQFIPLVMRKNEPFVKSAICW